MNMILKKRMANRRGRPGFTLVEVIVVLVILAILAAIAIPALTGYIDKAEDKKYIAMARDHFVAGRAVLDDAYATGELTPAGISYVETGTTKSITSKFDTTGLKYWAVQRVLPDARTRMASLLGQKYPALAEPGYWGLNYIGTTGSALWAADGFFFNMYPDGYDIGKECVYVSYKIKRLEGISGTDGPLDILMKEGEYDSKAGYELYYYKIGTGLIR
ncbi:MAG: prepilin-type N-terminal cleavage/methylation domain-containing protein [Clostridiales Family XIII bacterium]|jgi:prepilin-type N-terminal cleavage/methylation domain-containing protein|nr:prepilin-type N-terminal cleavage/methylation domain-containing protein [Clostridiales Family XIII bacterium]